MFGGCRGLGVRLRPDGAVGFDELLELFGLRQRDEIAGHKELLVETGGGVFHLRSILVAAQEQADGRIIAGGRDLGFPVIEVEVHLSGVAVLERTDLQVDQQVAAQNAVEEDEIEVVMFVADGDALLAGLEAEAGAEFEEE